MSIRKIKHKINALKQERYQCTTNSERRRIEAEIERMEAKLEHERVINPLRVISLVGSIVLIGALVCLYATN